MSKVNALLEQRLKKNENSSKMAEMARKSVQGDLTSFSGIFSVNDLNAKEKEFLHSLLKNYSTGKENISSDFSSLIAITSEVKAINNQAAMLHGERIKKAQEILTHYKDGAFTAWLVATYGNRQTPYNFLNYFLFHEHLPKALRPKLEVMPRQAVYTLASREGPLETKQKIVEKYQGETKAELLSAIREVFPLNLKDKRGINGGDHVINSLSKTCNFLRAKRLSLTKSQKQNVHALLEEIKKFIS